MRVAVLGVGLIGGLVYLVTKDAHVSIEEVEAEAEAEINSV